MSKNQDLIVEAEGDMTLISKEGIQRRVVGSHQQRQDSGPCGCF